MRFSIEVTYRRVRSESFAARLFFVTLHLYEVSNNQ